MGSYTEVFGGQVLYPAGQSYVSLSFAESISLRWPTEQQIGGDDIVASIIDLEATAAGLNVDFPDARQASNGVQTVFNNVGAETVTVRDADGGTILSLGPGEAWVVYLRDNTTSAGLWRVFQLGASVAAAVASALAGSGLKAISSTLNQTIPPSLVNVSPVNVLNSDRARLFIWAGGVGTLNLPDPATVGSDWFVMMRNSGSGDVTVTPAAGQIDGGATLTLASGESTIVATDGGNYYTVGYGQSTSSVFDFLEINVAGSGNYTLSGVELNRVSYRFTGTLTGNRTIIVPAAIQQYWVDNSTSGAFTLFIKTAAQVTPVEIPQGDRKILYCDGSDVVGAESSTVTFPIAVSQGGTGSTSASAARIALGVPPDTRAINAGTGLTGGGSLTSDRTISLDTANSRNVDHATLDITAGDGLTGGGALTADRELELDISALTNMQIDQTAATDSILVNDGGVMKQMDFQDMGVRIVSLSANQTFAKSDSNTIQALTGATDRTWTIPTEASAGWDPGNVIGLMAPDTADIVIDPDVGVTLTSILASGGASQRVLAGGMAVLVYFGSNEWALSGDIST